MEDSNNSTGTLTPLHSTASLAIIWEIRQINDELAQADDGGYIGLTSFFTECLRFSQATSSRPRWDTASNQAVTHQYTHVLVQCGLLFADISLMLAPFQPHRVDISLVVNRAPRLLAGPRLTINPALPQLTQLDDRLAWVEKNIAIILISDHPFSTALTWRTSTSTWLIPGVGYETGDVLEVPFEHEAGPVLHEGRIEVREMTQNPMAAPEKEISPPKPQKKRTPRLRSTLDNRSRDLEERLRTLQEASQNQREKNEYLRQELARIVAENEILRALPAHDALRATAEETITEPAVIAPEDVADELTDEVFLNAGTTWDYIQSHDLFKDGGFDVESVCKKLLRAVREIGSGPVFLKDDIDRAIQQSVVCGRADTLDAFPARFSESFIEQDASKVISTVTMTSPEADSPWSERDGPPPPYALSPSTFYHTSIEAMIYSSRRT